MYSREQKDWRNFFSVSDWINIARRFVEKNIKLFKNLPLFVCLCVRITKNEILVIRQGRKSTLNLGKLR